MIKKMIPEGLKSLYRELKMRRFFYQRGKKAIENSRVNKVFLLGIPLHGNLGDQAIAKATYEIVKEYLPGKEIIELPAQVFHMKEKKVKELIGNNLILIIGGGFLGSLWIDAEGDVRKVIKMFPNNKIVILPQTVYFEENEMGRMELENSKRIYGAHTNLHICVREKKSFELLKKEFPTVNTVLTPDTVLFIDEREEKSIDRKGILVCIREDKEGILDRKGKEYIIWAANKFVDTVNRTDTVCQATITLLEREEYLQNKLNEFRNAKMVITDRLHGMIFAAITGTPCFVLSNLNYKIKGVYEWIKELDYIHFSEDYHELEQWIPKLMSIQECKFNTDDMKEKFEALKEILRD